jgi:tetrahydromethanopterin S-methyltransferase subunit A
VRSAPIAIEDDALGQLDLVVTESIHRCDMCSITESTVTVNHVDTNDFDTAAQKLKEYARAERGDVEDQFLCQPVPVNQVRNDTTSSKSTLPCCIFECTKNVPDYIAMCALKNKGRL